MILSGTTKRLAAKGHARPMTRVQKSPKGPQQPRALPLRFCRIFFTPCVFTQNLSPFIHTTIITNMVRKFGRATIITINTVDCSQTVMGSTHSSLRRCRFSFWYSHYSPKNNYRMSLYRHKAIFAIGIKEKSSESCSQVMSYTEQKTQPLLPGCHRHTSFHPFTYPGD